MTHRYRRSDNDCFEKLNENEIYVKILIPAVAVKYWVQQHRSLNHEKLHGAMKAYEQKQKENGSAVTGDFVYK